MIKIYREEDYILWSYTMPMNNYINEAHKAEEAQSEDSSVKKRRIVIPGEVIATGEDYLPGEGARREGDNVLASRFGLAEEAGRVIKVIAITGAFIPRRNNVIIGRVTAVSFNGWIIDVDSASSAFLPIDESPRFINKSEMNQFLDIGEVVVAKIWSVNARGIDLSLKGQGLGKLDKGFIFRIIPNRVPRVIGREGSMITLIKENTGCNITVGQNGWIWVSGPSLEAEIKARKVIEFIVEKVYVSGLTELVEDWFVKNK
ncbi:MAG: exosome complex RNA-binding protein Rrp4 [Nanoarchaeota archaeon]|nr:exosome complex RNA-binding protein Rrp4 [Nanoarchaeota archaeon]